MNPRTQQCNALTDAVGPPSEHMTFAGLASRPMVLTALAPAGDAYGWGFQLPATDGIRREARIRARSRLTVSHWGGDVDVAARVAGELADNGARHGRPFSDGSVSLRLIVLPETGELLVQVDDAEPTFPGFEAAVRGGPESGLGLVQRQGVKLDWYVLQEGGDVVGKTVQAVVSGGWDEAA